jgi:hypothetical protein
MPYVKTKCGTFNTVGLLTVNKENLVYGRWSIILKYKSRKNDLHFRCKDETEANECIDEIISALEVYNSPLGGPIKG